MRTLAAVFAADLSLPFLAISTFSGWVAGCVFAGLSAWLPAQMEYHWRGEALATLGQASEPALAPRLVLSMRGGLPLLNALLTLLLALRFGPGMAFVGAGILGWCLLLLAAIDLKTTYLPDILTLPLLWLGLLFNLYGGFCPLPEAVIGAVAGYVSLWLLYWGFKLTTGQEGMGYGDFKLLAALGAWFGWLALPSMAFLSAISGVVFTLLLHAFQRLRGNSAPLGAFPFGPYLALAGLIQLFWQKDVFALFF